MKTCKNYTTTTLSVTNVLLLLMTLTRISDLQKTISILIPPNAESCPISAKICNKNRNNDLITWLLNENKRDITTVDIQRTLKLILRVFCKFIALAALFVSKIANLVKEDGN